MREARAGLHDLLPWYVAGSLDPEETAAFETHIRHCRPCDRDVAQMRRMRDIIERHGAAFFEPHPGVESIVAEAFDDLPSAGAGSVRAHLEFCPTCALESRLARASCPGTGAPVPAAPPRSVRWNLLLPWLAAAAVLLAIGVPVWLQRDQAAWPTGLVEVHYIEAVQRGFSPTVVRIPRSAPAFQIVLPVPLTPDDLPIAVSIRDREGRTVFARREAKEIYRDSFLFIACDRRDFPDGDYSVSVQPAATGAGGQPSSIEYRFRVTGR
jgi:hypothetical protein